MYIASASTSVKFHDFPNGNVVHNYQPGTTVDGPIRSISWSKDGNWLALVPFSGLTEIISVKDQLKLMYTVHDVDEPACASFQRTTKRYVALGTKSGQVLLYDIKSRCVKKRYPRSASLISLVHFTAKDSHIVAATGNGDVNLYSNIANNLACTFRVPKSESVSALQVNSHKRNLLVCGSNEGVIVMWDIYPNKPLFFTEAHKAPVTSITFSPINSDLILSTGLDRQFCFYDSVSRQCVATVPVSNNIMSADFSPDGINFVMGSQSGKLFVYDSRHIQEPIFSFDAHASAIKHLSFQKSEESDLSFLSPTTVDSSTHRTVESESKENPDSFGLYIEGSPAVIVEESSRSPSVTCPEAGDSFMAAMGLDGSNPETSKQEKSLGITEGVRRWMDSKAHFNETPFMPSGSSLSSSRQTKVLQERLCLGSSRSKQTSSTPKYLLEDLTAPVSPIISSSQIENQSALKVEDISTAVKDTVKTEMHGFLEGMKKDFDYQLKSGVSQMRRLCLDLQMMMIKEFIKLENNFNGLREDLTTDLPLSDHRLMEENVKLKKRIAELEDELSIKNGQNGIC